MMNLSKAEIMERLEPLVLEEVVTKIERGLIWIKTGPTRINSWSGRSLKFRPTQEEVVAHLVNEENNRRVGRKATYLLTESFRGQSLKEMMKNPAYSHYKVRDYGITVYGRSSSSPTGVIGVGGFDLEELKK